MKERAKRASQASAVAARTTWLEVERSGKLGRKYPPPAAQAVERAA